jgi:hypothetical protein
MLKGTGDSPEGGGVLDIVSRSQQSSRLTDQKITKNLIGGQRLRHQQERVLGYFGRRREGNFLADGTPDGGLCHRFVIIRCDLRTTQLRQQTPRPLPRL